VLGCGRGSGVFVVEPVVEQFPLQNAKRCMQIFRSKGSSSSNGLSRLALLDGEVWQEVFRISEGAVVIIIGNNY